MAMRPVYVSGFRGNLCRPTTVEFTYFNGFSKAQRQRCVKSLHEAFLREQPGRKPLEISNFSLEPLGVTLSAFNLMLPLENGQKVSVECAYQAGKVFEHGGPYLDLLSGTSIDAKKDPRLKNSGKIISFSFEGQTFPTSPRSLFYNWLYLKALNANPKLADALMEYDAFTDIVFNPEKSSNCQAEAAAYYVAVRKLGLLETALQSPEDFARILYKQDFHPLLFKSVFRSEAVQPVQPFLPSGHNIVKGNNTTLASFEPTKQTEEPYKSTFQVGDRIEHPIFGVGEVTNIEVYDSSARLTVRFSKESKTLDEKWITSKCNHKKRNHPEG